MKYETYQVIMLSGGQLRHYTVEAIGFKDAYKAAQSLDQEEYTTFTANPAATVLRAKDRGVEFDSHD